MDWMEMMQRLRLEHRPSLVNIDCDGCEHDIFRSALQTGQHTMLPDQIAVELHYPYAGKDTWTVDAMLRELHEEAGFSVIAHQVGDERAPCCQQVTLARTRCIPQGDTNLKRF
jgi:8-oxo-dGTP pyrophosphatase MutT (NUDIX family)